MNPIATSQNRHVRVGEEVHVPSVNLISPNTNMHVLVTVLHIFLMLLVGRICLNMKTLLTISFILTACMFEQVVIL